MNSNCLICSIQKLLSLYNCEFFKFAHAAYSVIDTRLDHCNCAKSIGKNVTQFKCSWNL